MRVLILAAIVFLSLNPAGVRAQYLDLAPIRLGVDGWSSQDVSAATIWADRSVPLYFFLPNVSEDSRVDILHIAAGVRGFPDEPTFAWRIAPLSLHITKAPWNGGVTLLEYDRSGVDGVRADWLSIHAGPAISRGPITARFTATAGLSTITAAGPVFVNVPEGGSTGALGALAASMAIRPHRTVELRADGRAGAIWGGDDPVRLSAGLSTWLSPDRRWSVGFGLRYEEARVSGVHEDYLVGNATIRFVPAALDY